MRPILPLLVYGTAEHLVEWYRHGHNVADHHLWSNPAQAANSALALAATASSGLLVSLNSTTPAVCSASGSTASLLSAGICTIERPTKRESIYAASPAVMQSFAVNPGSSEHHLHHNSRPDCEHNGWRFADGLGRFWRSSQLPELQPLRPSARSQAQCGHGRRISLAPGTCTIQANQVGNSIYAAAPIVTQSFTVESANPLTAPDFGAVNIGSASPAIAVPFTFGTAVTLGSVSVLMQGATGLDFANAGMGTCTAGTSYNAGSGCTVNVIFTPTLAGTRYGAVVLLMAPEIWLRPVIYKAREQDLR